MKKRILILLLVLGSCVASVQAQIGQQERDMWCWASCIQSALYQGNVNQSQTAIVSRLIGWPENRPASINEVVSILHSYNFRAWAAAYPASPQQLLNTLGTGWKVIAFVNPTDNPQVGHFIMLQGFSPNNYVIVSDPATGETYEQDIRTLYYNWKWSRSIVVGAPAW